MFIDEDRLAELSDKKVDVVIVGTGPAGISIALELESLNVDCLLIEAGGFDFPAKEELDPYEGEIIGRPYPLKSSRLRFFGGTSGHWGGWVKPLDEEDFNTWPVSYTEVYKYLPAAHKILEIDDVGYDGSSLTADKLIDTQDSKFFRTSNFQFSPPTRFGEKYRNRIKKSKKIYCALNTNLLQIKRDKDGVSTKLTVKTVSGSIQTIHGRAFVLAMGGIENPRYLLQSNLHLSNKYGTDHLGKCFMDHFALNTSLIYSKKAYYIPDLNTIIKWLSRSYLHPDAF